MNRGWVPKNKTDPTKRPDGQIEGEVTLTAVVRKTEKVSVMGQWISTYFVTRESDYDFFFN